MYKNQNKCAVKNKFNYNKLLNSLEDKMSVVNI